MKNRRKLGLGASKGPQGQAGLALLDLLMYATLIAGFLALAFYFGAKAYQKMLVGEEAQQFLLMSSDTSVSFNRSQGNYVGLNNAQLLALGLVPAKMISGNTIQSQAWSTPVTVAPASLTGATADAAAWTYQIPRKDCPDFINTISSAMAKVTVGGTVVKDVPNGASNLNVTALGTACNASAGTGNVAAVMTRS